MDVSNTGGGGWLYEKPCQAQALEFHLDDIDYSSKKGEYELSYEKIDVKSIDVALRTAAIRAMTHVSGIVFEVLYWIRQRAVSVRGGVGKMPVISWYSVDPLGNRGRTFTGLQKLDEAAKKKLDEAKKKKRNGKDDEKLTEEDIVQVYLDDPNVPEVIKVELQRGVPLSMVGKSAFAFSKIIRCICRAGLGLYDIDVKCSIYAHMRIYLADEFPAKLSWYIDNREEIHGETAKLMTELLGTKVSMAHVKNLFTRFAFNGCVDGWVTTFYPDFVEHMIVNEGDPLYFIYELEDAARAMVHLVAKKNPKLFAACKGKFGATLFHKYANLEATTLSAMHVTAHNHACKFISGSHDGIVVDKLSVFESLKEHLAPMVVMLKDVPSDPFYEAQQAFPYMDFTVRSTVSLPDYYRMWATAREIVKSKRAPENTIALADYVAARLDGLCCVPHSDGEKRQFFEMYSNRGWTFHNAADMKTFASRALHDLARPLCDYRADSKWIPPPPLNKTSFASHLTDHILAELAARSTHYAPIDGMQSRYKLLFADGILYDFRANEARAVRPRDRMGYTVPWKYEEYVPENLEAVEMLFNDICSMYRDGRDVDTSTSEGKGIIKRLDLLAQSLEVLLVIRKSQDCWSLVLYLLRILARCVVADARFCECLWLWGAAGGGKDVLLGLFLHFMGKGPNHYGYVLSGAFLCDKTTKPGKESASPFLAESAGKRFVWCSEVPEHSHLDTSLIKAFCEQFTPITARRLYRAPTVFEPMGLMAMSSNFPASIKGNDDGLARRLRAVGVTKLFNGDHTNPNYVKPDPALKERITNGYYNTQLLFLVKLLMPTLAPEICPGSNVVPMPRSVQQHIDDMAAETSERTGQLTKEQIRDWLEDKTEPCNRKQATRDIELKKVMAIHFGVSTRSITSLLVDAGVKSVPNSQNDRVYAYRYKTTLADDTAPGVLLKA